jgi:hypothetical protein
MVSEFDLPCTNCGGEITPVEVPVDGDPGTGSAMKRIGECVDCGARHYPEQALEDHSE